MIQIQEPELEALIQQRLAAGDFESVEELLRQALRDAPRSGSHAPPRTPHTGAELLTALMASPFKGLEIEFETHRAPMPVREAEL